MVIVFEFASDPPMPRTPLLNEPVVLSEPENATPSIFAVIELAVGVVGVLLLQPTTMIEAMRAVQKRKIFIGDPEKVGKG